MILKSFLEILYPDNLYCHCCGKIIDWSRTYGLCDQCMEQIKWTGDRRCIKCGKTLSENNPLDICYNCKENKHVFRRGFTCSEYGSINRSMIYSLKYDEKPAISRTIGEIMADRMLSEFTASELQERYSLLVPVPVSEERMQTRGYNQAALIAEYFAKGTGLSFYGEILERCKSTEAMRGLTPEQRRLNLQDSFEVIGYMKAKIPGADCLIVDDIMTTGATADTIATVLYHNDAHSVDFLSFANGADVIKS